MTEIEIKNSIDPLLKDLSEYKNLESTEALISKLTELLGIRTEDRYLLNIPRVDAELSRFELAPGFAKQPSAFGINHNKEDLVDLKLYWVKKTTKTNLSWLVGLTPNFEDSPANDFDKVGIDFVIPEQANSLIILLSNRFKVRSLEIHDFITPTQVEIFKKWSLININKGSEPNLAKQEFHETIWNSFDFEPVNRKFYIELVESFKVLVIHLEKEYGKKSSVAFTTRLLGRLLFIWFLRKKKIISDKFNYFDINLIQNQIDFYRNSLEILFFETLNKDISDRSHSDKFTPYLNGGLFDINKNDFYQDKKLTFPDGFFNHLFHILNKYNFTVDESSPEFQHVAIDPEMLGRIFESLLAEEIDETTGGSKKKTTGAFYTPREVVTYMCEEAVIQFLKNKIPDTTDRDRRLQELIRLPESIFRDQDQNKRRDWKPYLESIQLALDGNEEVSGLKVLDPAVGSGAFPMGMLQVLVKIYTRLDSKYEKNISQLKREILSRSIYGVDINQTAIEICRLRAWLTLIVDIKDGEEILPLPNLEFKFVCANSLITLPIKEQFSLFSENLLREKLLSIKDSYFKTNNKKIKNNLQKDYLELINSTNNDLFDTTKTILLKSYNPFDISNSAEFLDTDLMLSVSKFSIVIGNPPYIGESGHKHLFRQVAENSELKKYYTGKMDYFYFFFHLALDLCQKDSIVAFITTNYFITASGALGLRADLDKRSKIIKLINFNELKIFKNAKGQHNLITILNVNTDSLQDSQLSINHSTGDVKTGELDKILDGSSLNTSYLTIGNQKVFEGDKKYIRFINQDNNNIKERILDKLVEISEKISDYCLVNQGVVTGCDYVSKRNFSKINFDKSIKDKDGIFVLDIKNDRDVSFINSLNNDEKKLLRSFYKNSNINHFSCDISPNKYLLYINSKIHNIDSFPNIKKHLMKFKPILDDRREVLNGKIEWFDIQWSRNEQLFLEEKIVVPYRSATNNIGYNNVEWFCRSDVYIIKSKNKRDILIPITGLLNSKVIYFWLYNKGKKKGEILEMFPEFINEIPIKLDNPEIISSISEVTQKLINTNPLTSESLILALSEELNNLVFKLYELNDEEISVINNQYKN